MTAYSSYGSSTSLPILPMFLMGLVAALLALSVLGTGATVQIATPKPTPDSGTGIDLDAAVAEAKSLLTELKPGEVIELWETTQGYLRVGYTAGGTLFVSTGYHGYPALDAMAERVLAALVYH